MSSTARTNLLIHTKLNRPRLAANLIERTRLYTKLDRRRPLTIVVAPAGYGKTTLVSGWCEQCGMRCAWLTLDASNSNCSSFLDYLLAALERLFPQLVREIGLELGHRTNVSSLAAARQLADTLDAVDESFILVLDDYHTVSDPAIHRFLSEFLRYPPRSLNLVIASRVDPALPLAAMRAHDQLTEVRTVDLRFTRDEMADYLYHELDQVADDSTLTILEESLEGWITGLHLATLFVRNEKDIGDAARRVTRGNRFAVEYLASEVLAKQDQDVQSFLIKTSILGRMCPALCDAVLGIEPSLHHSRQILAQLVSADLFLYSVDPQDEWFRYHQLLQHLLRHQLRESHTPAESAALYAAASAWCAANNLIDEAITYAQASGDVGEAVGLLESHRRAAMNEERWQQLERWLSLFSRREIDSFPQLVVLEAWILHKCDRLTEIPERLDLAETLLDIRDTASDLQMCLRGEIDALRSQQYFWLADSASTYQSARRALDRVPLEQAGVRGIAWVFGTAGLFLSSGLRPALDLLITAAGEDPMQRTSLSARLLIIKCLLCWMGADMPGLTRSAEELLRQASRCNWQESLVWAHYFRGCANYQQNNLSAAADDFSVVMRARHHAPGFAFIQSAFGLALVLQAQRKPEEAWAVAASIAEYVYETGNTSGRSQVQAFQAYLALVQQRPEAVLRWLGSADRSFHHVPIATFFAHPLVLAAVLIHSGSPASLDEAERLLHNWNTYLSSIHIDQARIEVLVLQSQLFAARRQHELAVEALEHAVNLAWPGKVLRVLLDADPILDDVFCDLKLSGDGEVLLQQILNVRAQSRGTSAPSSVTPKPSPPVVHAQPHHPDLYELLTNREMEVLELLALRLTNKEIAAALNISPGTVKQHTMNVFRKLHIENRREAVVQAINMGFHLHTLSRG